MQAVANLLDIPKIGGTNLLYWLKEYKIISHERIPYSEYLSAGYFEIGMGSKNSQTPNKYLKPLATEKGLKWFQECIAPRIKEASKEYLEGQRVKASRELVVSLH